MRKLSTIPNGFSGLFRMDLQRNDRARPLSRHSQSCYRSSRLVKHHSRRFRPELQDDIITEVDRLITAAFIKEVQYPRWLANIVPVTKKNGQLRICVDFRDLNRACPKDDFPIPITEMVVDATTCYGALSFMDGSSGYNQIKMDENLCAYYLHLKLIKNIK